RHEVDLEERRQLADLHRAAAEAAEQLEGVVGDLLVALLEQLLRALRRAHDAGHQAAGEPGRARAERGRHARRSPCLSGWEGVRVAPSHYSPGFSTGSSPE